MAWMGESTEEIGLLGMVDSWIERRSRDNNGIVLPNCWGEGTERTARE